MQVTNSVGGDMMIDRVDERDTRIGAIRRADVFALRANFRVAHVFLFNHKDQLLVQQLAPHRERNPGFWGSSIAAYLFSGETYQQAAQRRLAQELGVHADLHEFGKTMMDDQGCKKFITLFVATCEGPFIPDDSQIARLEFLDIATIERLQTTADRRFTPTFLHVLRFFHHG